MAKTDWRFTDTVIPEDLNSIGEDINGLRTELSTRFDHEAATPLTLQPGLQVVHAAKSARFKLGEIRGRTLVNLLGGAGDCENEKLYSQFSGSATPKFFTTTVEDAHTGSRGIRATWDTPDMGSSFAKYAPISLVAGKTYLASVYVKTNNTKMGGRVAIRKATGNVSATTTQRSISYTYSYIKFVADGTESGIGCFFEVNNLPGYISYDSVCVYELSNKESIAIDNMLSEQISERYPFVPMGIVGVENPYVINTSGNLLPPFYNYEYLVDTHKVEGPYLVRIEPNINNPYAYSYIPFKVQPDTDYTLSIEGSNYYHAIYPRDLMVPDPPSGWSNSPSITFNSGNNSELLFLFRNADEILPADIRKPTITMGRHVNVFKPQQVTMFALQTELHANPADGSSPDVMLEKQGQYFKLKKWEKRTLENFSGWLPAQARPGYKVFACSLPNSQDYSQTLIKNNGNQVKNTLPDNWTSGDLTIIFNNYLYLSVNNTDSGWGERDELDEFTGDGLTTKFMLPTPIGFWIIPETVTASIGSINVDLTSVIGNEVTVATAPTSGAKLVVSYRIAYVPTGDEIKAYFMGWRMANPENWGVPYSTGIKAWGKLNRNSELVSGSGTTVLPTLMSDQGYKPYEILYRLRVDSVEPVVSGGGVHLNEGDNLLEVGAGIVLREQATPSQDNAKFWNLGNPVANPTSKAFKKKASRILSVYIDGMPDERWTKVSADSSSEIRGIIAQLSPNYEIDLTKIYSVTYIQLDKSPIQAITGTLATNEKAQINDLTVHVTEVLQRVSEVEQKKAEKDAPNWITPTLLNGWELYNVSTPIGYYKDAMGIVRLRGMAKSGSNAKPLFILPIGYRPLNLSEHPTITLNETSTLIGNLEIAPEGTIIPYSGGSEWLALDGITFLAEQ